MTDELSRNENIKQASRYLRGTLAEGLRDDSTGAIVEDDQQLVKFHGMYMQDDRDLRSERMRKKMEKAFSFMIRVRMPGGVVTPARRMYSRQASELDKPRSLARKSIASPWPQPAKHFQRSSPSSLT